MSEKLTIEQQTSILNEINMVLVSDHFFKTKSMRNLQLSVTIHGNICFDAFLRCIKMTDISLFMTKFETIDDICDLGNSKDLNHEEFIEELVDVIDQRIFMVLEQEIRFQQIIKNGEN